MKNFFSSRVERRQGQSMVELALLLPLVLGILFAIIDFGYYLYVNISVNHACREGVRIASMNNRTRTSIRSYIRQTAPGVNIPAASPADTGNPPHAAAGEAIDIRTKAADAAYTGSPPTVTVTVTFSHSFLVPLFMIGRSTATIYASSKSIVQTYGSAPNITF